MLRHLLSLSFGLVSLVVGSAHASSAATQELNAALAKTISLKHGAELFHTCAACHGASGNGSENGDVPRIAGQHFTVIVGQLVNYRHDARWDIRMEHYAGRQLLADPQSIADVAGYISQLSGEQTRNVGDGELVRHGAAVYSAKCSQCHGPTGEGSDSARVPRLAGQHYAYLLRQMYDAVDGRRPNFSRSHVRLLAKLQRDDFVGLADFLSRSEWTGPIAQVTQLTPEH
ncbi:MAG TPA: c-type cytochrome [Steroidobacteraceae bacterium]|nr:c-type cytochrome [Steroidobacteraceae bacterium]